MTRKELMDEMLDDAPKEELLKRLSIEDRLRGLSIEERMDGLSLEERELCKKLYRSLLSGDSKDRDLVKIQP